MGLRATARRIVTQSIGVPYALWRRLTIDVEVRRRTRASADGLAGPVRGSGHGPAFHRRYAISVLAPVLTPEEVVAVIAADPNVASPTELGCWRKRRGSTHGMAEGDRYDVLLPGPWNGPVEVLERGSRSFLLRTLPGHLEVGEIEFRARPVRDGMRLELESKARSATRLLDVLYDRLGISMAVQRHMWVQYLQRAAQVSGGLPGPVEVETHRHGRGMVAG